MATSLAEELEAQRCWRLRPPYEGSRVFDRMAKNEFRDPAALAAAAARSLAGVVAHAATTVPYYAGLFRRLRLDPAAIATAADLPLLPALGKEALRQSGQALLSRALPEGEQVRGWFASSGSTGEPTRVLHTKRSNAMFTSLLQRGYRWFRFDPAERFAIVRPPHSLPPRRDGKPHAADAMGGRAAWRYVGNVFRTGPLIYASASLPGERLLDWLAEKRPAYLQSYSETLEQLALAADGQWPAPSLRGLHAIAQQVTPAMRHRIETTTGVAVQQVYGLNEIGMVAVRCAAGRYHVHAEHCLVELVDGAGQPARAGTIGHVLVTGLNNPAMPLLRYDTGDLAQVVDGPCPCGRTLPSFGEIEGRYGRVVNLPEGTAPLVRSFRSALGHFPQAMLIGLRQYQLHQFRDGRFELRLVTRGAPRPGLTDALAAAWQASGGTSPLRIVGVDSIPLPRGGKFQDFTSDFMPDADPHGDPPPAG